MPAARYEVRVYSLLSLHLFVAGLDGECPYSVAGTYRWRWWAQFVAFTYCMSGIMAADAQRVRPKLRLIPCPPDSPTVNDEEGRAP
jgi:hypothetical protein